MVLLHRLADSATVVTGAVVGLVADAAHHQQRGAPGIDVRKLRHEFSLQAMR
jgi:hypothetical protein